MVTHTHKKRNDCNCTTQLMASILKVKWTKKKSSFSFQLFPSAEAYFNLVSLVSSRFIEIHRVVWVGKDSRDYPVPTSLSWAGTPSTTLPAPPKLAVNTSRDEVSTAPLGGLLQCSITPVGNNFFQIPKLNLPFCFRLLPSVLSFHSIDRVPL